MTVRVDYADYSGPPLDYTAQPVDDLDVEILVRLARPPSADEASSLERAIPMDSQFGPRWTGATLRWLEDFGTADAQIAADDLARRLAGWSAARGVAIVELNFGQYGTR